MARPKNCIYCVHAEAKSREHLWPAASGGRRRRKGITCHQCNKGFQALDERLASDLYQLSALLGVRPDHGDSPHMAKAIDRETGEEFHVDAGSRLEQLHPRVRDEDGNTKRMSFDSREARDRWLEQQRRAGRKLVLSDETESYRYFVDPLWVPLSFGGEETFRALARVAINFLAHFYPDAARDPGFDPIKNYILKRTQLDGAVFYDFGWTERAGLPPLAAHAHRMVIGFDPETGEAFGHVNVFSIFEIGIRLGKPREQYGGMMASEIFPTRELPDDAVELSLTPVSAPWCRDEFALENELKPRLGAFMRRRDDQIWEVSGPAILERVSIAMRNGEIQRHRDVKAAIFNERQRILSNAAKAAKDVAQDLRTTFGPGAERYARLFDAFAQRDALSESTVTKTVTAGLSLVEDAIADEIISLHSTGSLTLDVLRDLLEDDLGKALALQVMARLVSRIIPGFEDIGAPENT